MKHEKISTDDIAYTLIHLSEYMEICDKETSTGFKTSNKKGILKSTKEHSFSKFTKAIKKRQTKKDCEDINNDD